MERRAAAVARLTALREAGDPSPDHVRLAAEGLGVSERTVRRWMEPGAQPGPSRPGTAPYLLSETDREAFAYFRGNIAAVHRARAAAVAGLESAAGVPIPAFLREGWSGAKQPREHPRSQQIHHPNKHESRSSRTNLERITPGQVQ